MTLVMARDMTSTADAPALTQGLTQDEDDELRRLHYFNQVGHLAGRKLERFLELRLRDRRKEIRPPREFLQVEQRTEAVKAGRRFISGLFR